MSSNSHIPRIGFLDQDSLPDRIQIPAPASAHKWVSYTSTTTEQVIERCQGLHVVVTNKVPITEDILQACPLIKHIAVTATGYNIIDLEACRKHNVSVSNIPSYAATTVSEHVIACALSLRRELQQYRQRVIDGAWQHSPAFCLFDKPIQNLAGATLGIIGFGEIGQATATLAKALGMNIIFTSRRVKQSAVARQVEFDELLQQSDVISVHCSLNTETENLLTHVELARMQPHAILINTARGGIVNEPDLVSAIENDQIAGVAIDVLSEEPPNDNSPLLTIANRSNVIVTPHIAWASEQAMQQLADTVSQNIDAFLRNSPQNLVS